MQNYHFWELIMFTEAGVPFYLYRCACADRCVPPCRPSYRTRLGAGGPSRDKVMPTTVMELFLKKGYAAVGDDRGIVPTDRGRERLAQWEETMAIARQKVSVNNARQKRASLERKLAKITAELETL